MAGIDLTGDRRSQLLELLLSQQNQRTSIQSAPELLAKLGAQLIRQKKIKGLQEQEANAQQQLIDAMQAGQATSPTVQTLENFEGGSGRQQVAIPGKKAVPSEQQAAIAKLPPQQQLQAMQLMAAQKEAADPTAFQQRKALQEDAQSFEAEQKTTAAANKKEELAAQFNQRDKELMLKLDADELAQVRDIQSKAALLDKRIQAETAAAGVSGGNFKSSQWIAAGYGVRAEDAAKTIDDIGGKFTGLKSRGVGLVPQGLRAKDRQRFNQAKRNFINAQLRRESGAVISDQEFANADLQYFPQPGDKDAVLKEKKRNRSVVVNALRGEAGGAYNQLKERLGSTPQEEATTTSEGLTESKVIDFNDLPE